MSDKSINPGISFAESFAVCVCVGLRPDIARDLLRNNYQSYTEFNLTIYDRIAQEFESHGLGHEIRRDPYCVHIMCALPIDALEDIPYYVSLIIESMVTPDCSLFAGIGIPAFNELHLNESDETAVRAYEMYYFGEKQICEYMKIRQSESGFSDSSVWLDKYSECLEASFRAVLIKSPEALDVIDEAVDTICKIHYGNKRAFSMRCMNFSGELADRLRRYRILEGDALSFFKMQDELQSSVLDAVCVDEVKEAMHEFYDELLARIFSSKSLSRKSVIDKIITYMRENFMEDLNIRSLSEVACVSPNYFSHMFKNETGQNFKAYLTDIRMAEALRLLSESDYKVYEICEKVGYNNVRTFVDAFKQKYGKGPGAYRRG